MRKEIEAMKKRSDELFERIINLETKSGKHIWGQGNDLEVTRSEFISHCRDIERFNKEIKEIKNFLGLEVN